MFLKCSASKRVVYFQSNPSLGRGCNDFSHNTRRMWFLRPCNLILFLHVKCKRFIIDGGDCSRKSLQFFHAVLSAGISSLAGGADNGRLMLPSSHQRLSIKETISSDFTSTTRMNLMFSLSNTVSNPPRIF